MTLQDYNQRRSRMAGEGGEHAVSGLEEWQWPVVEELYRMYTQVRLAMYSVQCTVYSVQ